VAVAAVVTATCGKKRKSKITSGAKFEQHELKAWTRLQKNRSTSEAEPHPRTANLEAIISVDDGLLGIIGLKASHDLFSLLGLSIAKQKQRYTTSCRAGKNFGLI
jgi:hypothetical protein